MLVRCLVRLDGPGENPEDVYQNTWYLNASEPTTLAAVADVATPRFKDFYQALAGYLSNCIQPGGEVRFYNMADPPIRNPEIRPLTYSGGQAPGLLGLPEEVCVCLTMHGANPKARRGRGRLFIGPLNQSVIGQAAGTNAAVHGDFVAALASRAQAFLADSGRGGLWVVYTKATDTWTTVTNGWIDNAFDTQRRRGPEAGARTEW